MRERFPLTADGWGSAWQALRSSDADAAATITVKLAERAERNRAAANMTSLDAQSLCSMRNLVLKGASGDVPLTNGRPYDLRFLSDRLTVCAPGSVDAIVEVPYVEVEAVEASGSGHTGRTSGEMTILVIGLALLGALLGLLILGLVGLLLGAVIFAFIGAAVGSASTKSETVIRVRGANSEYFFVHEHKSADDLRVELSGALRAIDAARAVTADRAGESEEQPERISESVPDQLSKLASLLNQGLLSRDEFDQLKSKVIAGS